MTTCILCRFEVPADDAVVPTASGRCICLGCFTREVGSCRPMPRQLRRQISAVLVAAEVA
jgi:hypothetical protein